MKGALQRRLEKSRAEVELRNFSDHMLKDIGIERSDIRRVVRGNPSVLDRPSRDAPC
jgi:uncharacterized protein YjiS (DUF1127 family)